MPRPDRRATRIDETDAKGGSNEGVVRWVLLFSLGGAIIALTIIWVTGALTEGPVESEGTSTGRIEAAREQAQGEEDLAEEADLIAPGTTEPADPPAATATGTGPDAD